jgi:hypothetical protein
MPNRDILNFITSGRMSSLRELSIAIDYKDWVCNLCYKPPLLRADLLASFPSAPTTDTPSSLIEHPLYRRSCHTGF